MDPFDTADSTSPEHVHIRIQQRKKRRTLTIIQGLSKDLNLPKILKNFKKVFFSFFSSVFNCIFRRIQQTELS